VTLLLIGLGNPGTKFDGTRHNTGFNVVDKIALKFGVQFKKAILKPYQIAIIKNKNNKYILIKPLTYMNRSGVVIPGLLTKFKLTNNNIVIIVDNLDINKGNLKFKLKGSDGGHNGLKSVNEFIGTTEYKRLFIGIGRPEKGVSITDYVLSKIESNEVLEAENRAVDGILDLEGDNISQIMNYLNRRKID
jgi:peptidyl-tRNA hydrolase, PTH1 family